MPLHLLGKKSWNVYNSANIARVKADEEAAAAREAADEQRMQELDAERRAAILRGRTPPPLPNEVDKKEFGRKRERDDGGYAKKRRKLAGEDDTDMDIRLAASTSLPGAEKGEDARVLKLRNTKLDAPLTDHAGHIDLFPVDMKEAIKREKNTEAEKEKRKKERAFEDQYTMRFSNAAGREGLETPWYAAQQRPVEESGEHAAALEYPGIENKDVWGNEDPRRKEREKARMTSNDPFAFMQQAQTQLKRSKEDKKKWAAEHAHKLRELRAIQEREDRRSRHHKRKKRDQDNVEKSSSDEYRRNVDKSRSSKHKHRHGCDFRIRSREKSGHGSSHRQDRLRSRSRSKDRKREAHSTHSSSRRVLDDRCRGTQ
ncbi:hypothetical protein BDU57DRAFT_496795 [Ampelomyces quisqualis]|uniref:CBF1-interacting co-repressor CIR N-terminal domain-containing protein n=1 Tax=Ampelomyces quisqualis TaxID=50730 RepID=A0A6A5QNB7_AMPQU|nr:hypothetical protein BDU57DRAFT_496795 [Ampelomyces quisqualis]